MNDWVGRGEECQDDKDESHQSVSNVEDAQELDGGDGEHVPPVALDVVLKV